MSNFGQNYLFLDDDVTRQARARKLWPACTIVETAADCIAHLKGVQFTLVMLDHDLGGEQFVDSKREDCGMEVVRWMVANKPKVGQVVIHSFNPPAAAIMKQDLINAGYDAHYIPFGTGKLWAGK